MARDVLRHFFGGFVRMHVLYHAAKEPIWGAEMMEELRRHEYNLGPGTLYPILHHLEEAGYLTSKTIVVSGKRRKNYRITRAGRKLLQDARDKLRELVSEVLEDRDAMHMEQKMRPKESTKRGSAAGRR
jgi:DNA-binding PadR family transcriptional regulator